MAVDVIEMVDNIREAHTAEELHATMSIVTRQLGFRYWCLVQRGHDDIGFAAIQYQNYPREWIEALERGYYYLHDPVLAACRQSALPFCWTDLPKVIALTPKQLAYMATAKEMGLAHGLSVPWHLPGEPSALCSMAGEHPSSDPEVLQKALCVVAWAMQQARKIKEATTNVAMGMNKLERRVLTLVSRGISPGSIAAIEGITRDEVVGITRELQRSTRSSSTIQVVVRKLHSGELTTTELLW